MYSRAYKTAVAVPPLVWVAVFLLAPYAFLFCYSFWTVSQQVIVRHWNLGNYRQLLDNSMYPTVLFRSMRIAASVTVLSLLFSFPLAYYLSFHSRRKELLYQLVIIPLWVSYLFPLSLPGALAGATFAFVLSLGDFLAPLLIGGPSGIMISNVVVSLFGAAYNWPLGAAISASLLLLVLALLFLVERIEKRLSFS